MEAPTEPQSPSEKKINLQATGTLTSTPSFPEVGAAFLHPSQADVALETMAGPAGWTHWVQQGELCAPATQHWTKCLEASSIKWQCVCTFFSFIFLSHLLRLPRSALILHPSQ